MKETEVLAIEIARQTFTLAAAAFTLVAALAWNELVQTFINTYVVKWLGIGGGLASQAIYAIVVTVIAVAVSFQLTRISKRLEKHNE